MKTRSIEEIKASGVVRLQSEGPRVVPLSGVTLWRRANEGRLEVFGEIDSADYEHLLAQYKAGFPSIAKTGK